MGTASTAARNFAADDIAGRATHIAAFTANPGDTGANEVTGGVYARQPITWAAASGGTASASNTPEIPIPAGTTVTHIGLFTASSGGTFLGSEDNADETYGGDGILRVTSYDINVNPA